MQNLLVQKGPLKDFVNLEANYDTTIRSAMGVGPSVVDLTLTPTASSGANSETQRAVLRHHLGSHTRWHCCERADKTGCGNDYGFPRPAHNYLWSSGRKVGDPLFAGQGRRLGRARRQIEVTAS